MEVIVAESAAHAAALAADAVVAHVRQEPRPVLGLATGSSPLKLYAELRRRYQAREVSFAHVRAYLLDEYVGLTVDHPQTYANVIQEELVRGLDFPAGAVRSLNGGAHDVRQECASFERLIEDDGGVGLQVLGVGSDGHLAFNEPGSSLMSRTRIKTLTERTRADNARFFKCRAAVPHHVLTQGLGTILEARHLLLLASGEAKALAVRRLVEGPLSAQCPASVLQLHPHATVLLDPDAASGLARLAYYREAFDKKPAWQGL